jgi:hypothetical protein
MSIRLFYSNIHCNLFLLAKPSGVEYNATRTSGRSSARLERCVRVAEAPGSNPGAPTSKNRLIGRFFYPGRSLLIYLLTPSPISCRLLAGSRPVSPPRKNTRLESITGQRS